MKKAYLLSVSDLQTGKTGYKTTSEDAQCITRYRHQHRVYATVAIGEGADYESALVKLGHDSSVGALLRHYGDIPGVGEESMELLRHGYMELLKHGYAAGRRGSGTPHSEGRLRL